MPITRQGSYQYPKGWINKGPWPGDCGHVVYDQPEYFNMAVEGNRTDASRLCSDCRYQMARSLDERLEPSRDIAQQIQPDGKVFSTHADIEDWIQSALSQPNADHKPQWPFRKLEELGC